MTVFKAFMGQYDEDYPAYQDVRLWQPKVRHLAAAVVPNEISCLMTAIRKLSDCTNLSMMT